MRMYLLYNLLIFFFQDMVTSHYIVVEFTGFSTLPGQALAGILEPKHDVKIMSFDDVQITLF